MGALADRIYSTFFKRNSVYTATIFAGAFAFGVSFNAAVDSFWDRWNRGKQWKDIKPRYVQNVEE